jgi:hypothetical protein
MANREWWKYYTTSKYTPMERAKRVIVAKKFGNKAGDIYDAWANKQPQQEGEPDVATCCGVDYVYWADFLAHVGEAHVKAVEYT